MYDDNYYFISYIDWDMYESKINTKEETIYQIHDLMKELFPKNAILKGVHPFQWMRILHRNNKSKSWNDQERYALLHYKEITKDEAELLEGDSSILFIDQKGYIEYVEYIEDEIKTYKEEMVKKIKNGEVKLVR